MDKFEVLLLVVVAFLFCALGYVIGCVQRSKRKKKEVGSGVEGVLMSVFKNVFAVIIMEGFETLVYGEKRKSGYRQPSRTSYCRNYTDWPKKKFTDIILETRGEAEEVWNTLLDIIKAYGCVTVADLYALIGVDTVFTDNKYGWQDLGPNTVIVRYTTDGYLLDLPEPILLD